MCETIFKTAFYVSFQQFSSTLCQKKISCYFRLNFIYFENINLFGCVLSLFPVVSAVKCFSVGLFSRCLQMDKQKQTNFYFTKTKKNSNIIN